MTALPGTHHLYSSLLLGAMNDMEDLAASGVDLAPGVWLDPLRDSDNDFEMVCCKSAFASADSDCSVFPPISK